MDTATAEPPAKSPPARSRSDNASANQDAPSGARAADASSSPRPPRAANGADARRDGIQGNDDPAATDPADQDATIVADAPGHTGARDQTSAATEPAEDGAADAAAATQDQHDQNTATQDAGVAVPVPPMVPETPVVPVSTASLLPAAADAPDGIEPVSPDVPAPNGPAARTAPPPLSAAPRDTPVAAGDPNGARAEAEAETSPGTPALNTGDTRKLAAHSGGTPAKADAGDLAAPEARQAGSGEPQGSVAAEAQKPEMLAGRSSAKPRTPIAAPDPGGANDAPSAVSGSNGSTGPNGNQGLPFAVTSAASAPAASTAGPQPALATAAVPIAAVAVEIATRAQTGSRRFEIRLDPPELGRIDVRLDVDKHGNISSRLVVERSETLDLLRREAPQLERALQDAGLKTGDGGLQFSLRDQNAGAEQQARDDRLPHAAHVLIPDTEAPPVEVLRSYRWGATAGGIDIRV